MGRDSVGNTTLNGPGGCGTRRWLGVGRDGLKRYSAAPSLHCCHAQVGPIHGVCYVTDVIGRPAPSKISYHVVTSCGGWALFGGIICNCRPETHQNTVCSLSQRTETELAVGWWTETAGPEPLCRILYEGLWRVPLALNYELKWQQ